MDFTTLSLRMKRIFTNLGVETADDAWTAFDKIVKMRGVGKSILREYYVFLRNSGYHPPHLYEVEWYNDGPHFSEKLTLSQVFQYLRERKVPVAESGVTVRLFV